MAGETTSAIVVRRVEYLGTEAGLVQVADGRLTRGVQGSAVQIRVQGNI